MPRINISSALAMTTDTTRGLDFDGSVNKQQQYPGSVRLSCLSLDGTFVHSLLVVRNKVQRNVFIIESKRLPLPGSVDDDEEVNEKADDEETHLLPATIRTELPDIIQNALSENEPIELLCVDAKFFGRSNNGRNFPIFCVYTCRDAFSIELAYYSNNDNSESSSSSEVAQGKVVSWKQPFESDPSAAFATTRIIRIRPAPQCHEGHVAFCPPGAIAMLTHDQTTNEYTLSLCHSVQRGHITFPLNFGFEQLVEEEESITDFCFAQSSGLPLFASMAILLLKGNGDVLAASPIVFSGAVFPRSFLQEGMEFLDTELEHLETGEPKWRQYKAAKQYLVDAFPDDGGGQYVTARVENSSSNILGAVHWRLQIQGPVMQCSSADPSAEGKKCLTIETMFASDLIGVAVGREGFAVELGVVSPTCILPRFVHETPNLRAALDDHVLEIGAVVHQVLLPHESSRMEQTMKSLALVRDPAVKSMIHFVSPGWAVTISTNCFNVVSRKVQSALDAPERVLSTSKRTREEPESIRASAWSCLDASRRAEISIEGAVVSGNAQFGHVLISRLSDGTMVPVNVTESQYLREMDSQFSKKGPADSIEAPQSPLDAEPSFHDQVAPIIAKVTSGLAGMGKIVGSATPYKDISPEALAVAINVKDQCDKDVVLPILELHHKCKAHRAILKQMHEQQKKQVAKLRNTIAALQEGMKTIVASIKSAEVKSQSLARRSATVLQMSKTAVPSITQAESDYFKQLDNLRLKCEQWEQSCVRLTEHASSICESMNEGKMKSTLELPHEMVGHYHKLLKGQEKMLRDSCDRLMESEYAVAELADATGVVRLGQGAATGGQ